jgi:uncharacterized membrane protein YgdD (TMEM256/DUF423 family)
MDRGFLVLGAVFGFLGVAAGAFGSHALRSRLTAERLARFEVAVRYQLWHTFALFVVVVVRTIGPDTVAASVAGIAFAIGSCCSAAASTRWRSPTSAGGARSHRSAACVCSPAGSR